MEAFVLLGDSEESLFFIKAVGAGRFPVFNFSFGLRHLQLKLFIVNLVSLVVVPERKPIKLSGDDWI